MKGFIKKIDLLLCVLFMFIFSLHAFPLLSSRLLTYDEADYAMAASKGVFANYIDRNSISFLSFVKKGLSAFFFKKHALVAKEIRQKEDVAFYRHFHPPFFVYPACIFIKIFGEKELSYRLGSFLAILLTIPLVYFFTLYFTERTAGAFAAFFVSISPVLRHGAILFVPHALYTFLATLFLFLLGLLLKNEDKRILYSIAVLLGISFLTHEYSWILLFTFFLSLLVKRSRFFSVDRAGIHFSWSLFLFFLITAGTFMLLWPSGILKLGVVKEYMFHFYNAISKKGMWKSMGILGTIKKLFLISPADIIMVIGFLSYGIYLIFKKEIDIYLFPFFIYIGIFGLLYILRAPPGLTYISSCYPGLYIVSGIGISRIYKDLSKRTKGNAVGMILVGILGLTVLLSNFLFLRKPVKGKEFLRSAIAYLEENAEKGGKVLVSFGCLPTLKFYLRDKEIDMDMIHLSDNPEYIAKRLSCYADYFVFVGKKDSLAKTEYADVLKNRFYVAKHYKYDDLDVLIYRKIKR